MEIRKFVTEQDIEFDHCVGTKEEVEEMQKVPANFFSYKETDTLLWIHLTSTNNIPSILEKGLISGEGHLGKGVYVCSTDHLDSLKSFMEFAYNAYLSNPNADFSLVLGSHSGDYLYCVYGDAGHTGYCLIEQDLSNETILGTHKIEKEDFMKMNVLSLKELAEDMFYQSFLLNG